MSTCDYCIIGYLVIGMILTGYWWFGDYKQSYEECKAKGECEEPMVIIFWLLAIYTWPVVLCVRFIGKQDEKRRQNQFRKF